jgi:hypothetical protein
MKIRNFKLIILWPYRWCTRTRLRKILSSILAALILLTSIKYLFLPAAPAKAADVYLNLDEGYGTTVNDGNQTITAPTIHGATWQPESMCVRGKCLSFNGTSDYVSLGATSLAQNASSMTLETWFKTPQNITSFIELIDISINSGSPTTNSRAFLELANNNAISAGGRAPDSQGVQDRQTANNVFTANRWYHAAAVINYSTNSVKIYLNGVELSTTGTSTFTNPTTDNTTSSFGAIGAQDDGSTGFFKGFIDEVKIYSSARTADQVKADFNGETKSQGVSASFGPNQSYLSDGLVGYWKLDETSANTCTGGVNDSCDASGNSLDGAWGGNATNAVGRFGPGVTFDGTTDYISISDNTAIKPPNDLTISFWVNLRTLSRTNVIMSKDGSGGGGYYVQVDSSNVLQFGWRNSSSTLYTVNYPGNVSAYANIWIHVVAVKNNNNLYIYLNGVQGTNVTATTGTIKDTPDPLYLGAASSNSNTIDGVLDDVRIFNRALSQADALHLYNFAPGPVGWWKMDDNSGTSANDSSTTGNAATLSGTTIPTWATGKFGSALKFDGSASYLNTNLNTSYTAYTFSTWVYAKSNGGGTLGRIFDKRQAGNEVLNFFLESDYLSFNQYFSSGQANWHSPAASMPQNQWVYVAVTYDASAETNDPVIYINGVAQAMTRVINPGAGTVSTTTDNYIIGNRGAADRAFDGFIDDFKIYNYVRSPSQVTEDMNGGHPAPGSPIGSAIGHWKLDEGNGTTAHDSSINGRNLTLSSSTSWTNAGKFGKAWKGDGSTWLSVANTDDFNFAAADNFTLSAWVKSTSASNPGSNEFIFDKESASPGYALIFSTNGHVFFGIDDDNSFGPDDSAEYQTDIYDGNWHHVVATKTGTSRIDLYVDGILQASNTALTAIGTLTNTDSLTVGAQDLANGTDEFNGTIDEPEIFRSALTADQIKVLYNQGSSAVMGAVSTDSSGTAASFSSQRSYCPPGNTEGNCGSGDPSPIGEWNLDDNTGTTTAVDTSGNGNNGTITNLGSTTWVPGIHGSALNFDSTATTKIDAGTPSIFNNLSALTAETWIYPRTAGGNSEGRFIDKTNSTGPSHGWYFKFTDSTRTLQFKVDYATIDLDIESTNIIPVNQWSHVVLTWDGNADPTSSHARIFINGIEASYTGTATGTGGRVDDSTGSVKIGNSTGSNRTFDGYIDEAKVYNYVRTPNQVAWDYNQGRPVGWWKFDECSGTTAHNSVLNANGQAAGMDATISIGGTGTYTSPGTCGDGNGLHSWNAGTTGKYNAALAVDSTDDYAFAADTSALDFTTSMTLSAWVKSSTLPSAAGKNIEMVNKYLTSTNQRSYRLFVDKTDDHFYFYTDGDGASGSTDIASSDGTFTTGVWHHVVGVFQNSTASIYVDGKLQATTANQGFTTIFNGTADFVMGMDANKTSAPDGALIDDVRAYNYALTKAQVQLLYNEGAAVRYGP